MSTRLSTWMSRTVLCALGIAMFCLMPAITASAQPKDKRTTVTFSAPFEVPRGNEVLVLPAGTYVFKLLDTVNDRSVVQIFSKDEATLHTTILAIPNYRLKATSDLVMTFAERSAGNPQALRAWFCPGDNWGQEFVYPKAEAMMLAQQTQAPVLYLPDAVKPTPPNAPPVTVKVLKDEPVKAVTPVGTDVPVIQVVEPPPVQTAPSLPKTAGELPLLVLIGMLLLAVGATARALRCAR